MPGEIQSRSAIWALVSPSRDELDDLALPAREPQSRGSFLEQERATDGTDDE